MHQRPDRAVTALLATALEGQLSRREILRRALALGLSAPTIAALLAACGGGEAAGETPTTAPGGTPAGTTPPADRPVLRYGLNAGDLGNLDPHFASSTNDRTVVDMVFNALVRYKPGDNSQFEPDLATAIPEPEMVDGKQVWTFTLRQGVMWHPGPQTESYELTADDVVFSLQKSANADTSAYAAEYAGMTVEKVDDDTVRITLDTPLSPILFLPKVANYSGGFIVSKRAVEAMGADGIKTHPVGTGPFMFRSYTPQNAIELVAWDNYFRGAPKLAGVTLRFMPDASSRELALQSGELDVAAGIPEARWVDKINGIDGLRADVFGVGEVTFVNFDMSREPLTDVRVRQALAYAINREAHLALFGEPVAQIVYSVAPAALMVGGLTREEAAQAGVAYDYDPDRARQLLAEAGVTNLTFDLVTSEMDSYRRNYEVLQAELAEIGVQVNLTVVDHPTYHSLIRENANQIVIYVAFRPNPDAYFSQFFHADAIVVTGPKPNTNFSHYDQVDDLIEQARTETDPDQQVALWKQINTRILQDMAALPILFINQVYGRSERVDYGHELKASLALYPQITEQTTITS
ncbi:MAG: ABC transporter substrate-binding protein [Sphaerobacter sp.]|nr:ABC transporter substrate-binding protein [Sphaerobacter sp.]